ncbi:hypothetical protein OS493_023172 [Desmophyllum pertusum]|uniref:Uncharacterized protein n=1 Tax=Desmophyllum pertusum TaxID=174260 RepID=A0A9W9YYR8_9CNID|nr:hypothetical protein OS493_023172 [Desmophyllum pertusum]
MAGTTAASESVVEGDATASESIPKKKKKKKRKNEHCDQTSQTKFRIKKKKKSESKRQDLEGSPDAMLIELKNAECLDLTLEDVENSQCEGGNGENSSQAKSSLSRPTIEKVTCARTAGYQGCAKGSSFKTKLYASESSSGGRLIDLTDNTSSSELAQAKMVEKISLDGCMPNSSDREIDVGDESVLSDLSDHSSDIEIDPCSCFLLNNKIDKVEKEELQEGEDIVDVDVETVGKETSKNFLVVSGVEAGHFSYHPGMTKEGTIDTSIQALPNEIDIFLQCAKMQEGEMIKIINPDDSDELHSHFTQKNGRNPETVKATRSATERKRRHHLGDLFSDMKLAVYNFTDLVDADLYLSKQAILSKGIGTIEDLEKESREMNNAKRQLTKTNKKLEEKRNMLLFGKPSVDVDSAKVEDIFNHLNINVDEEEIVKTEENANSNEDVAVDAAEKSKVVVEPSVKGRPRAKKTLLSPWVANNTPVPKNKDDLSSTAADLHPKTSTNNTLETSKEILGTSASSSLTLPAVHISNVSCGVQTLEVEKDAVKSFTLGNPTISFSSIEKDSSKSFTLGNPTISFSSVEKDSSKSFTLGNPPVSLPSDSHAAKATPLSESTSQEGSKASLPVKILPKPTILHLQSVNPTQQKALMDTLGQVKQPSSDKIICNLSRLSTQQNPNKPSSICIIRSGQLMTSLDSKNVMHIKITNDALKKVDGGSSSTTSASTSQSSQQVSNTTMATRVPGFLTLGVAKVPEAPGTSRAQTLQKRPENTVLVSQIPLKSTTTPSAKVIFSGKPFGMLTSISNTGKSQSTSQASSEMTLRALASLSQLQANKPPLMGTTTKPVGFNENPVAGVLPGLKNVVMKVVPARPVVQSTTSVLQFLPTATVTTAFKGATSSHVTVTSSQGKCPTSTKGPTISVIPVISVPSSSSLNSSFTTSALNSPILSSGINTLPTKVW